MRAALLVSLFALAPLLAEEPPAKEAPINAQVHPDAVPSLVNFTALPSAIVNGSVNVITGDLIDTEQDDIVSGPDPYVLGHSYCSSSLEEGNLGDGWSFLHHHLLEVYQPGRYRLVQKGTDSDEPPILHAIEYFEQLLQQSELDIGISPMMSDAPLEEEEEAPNLIAKGVGVGDRDHKARPNRDRKRFQKGTEPIFLSLYEPSGGRLLFKAEFDVMHKERSCRHFKLQTEKSGYTNITGGQISGQSNIKNIRLSWDKEQDRFTVTFGDGTERVYERQASLKEMKKKDRHHAKYYLDYQLHKEIKPSGNIVIYHYNDEHEISNITTYNSDFTHKLNSVDFEQKSPQVFAKHPSLHVKTSDNLDHVYYFKKLNGSMHHGTYSVAGIKRQGWPYIDYEYSKKSSRHKKRVVRKEHQNYGYVKTKYYRWEDNQVGSHHINHNQETKKSKFLHNRVRLQTAPVGPNGQEEITHRYYYYKGPKGGGHTTVREPYGLITRYYWNKEKRLTSIKKYLNKKLLKSERFTWGKDGSDDEGRLMSHVLYAENGSPKLCRTYEYDSHGNITEETLHGHFKTLDGSLRTEANKPHHASCDTITTTYTYSKDGLNLKTSECDDSGNYTYYEYVKGTNLLKAKLSCFKDKIKKREFFRYDKNAIMIEQIIDDGSSHDKDDLKHVTERHITRITPRTERPHFGESEVIEEYYLDHDKEVLLTKTIHQFNAQGFIQKKIVIADTETYQEFTYDDIGRVLSSKDPLGQITTYTYNKAGLIETKRGPRPDVTLHYIYDKLGHLIEEREEQEHNLTLVTTYAYDLLGRKISETTPQGHTTHYEYDGLNRITQIRYPITYDHEGKEVRPTKSYTYEKLGMIVTETNENGHETTSDYSALGKLLHVKYADGTKRSYEYDLKGNCVKEIAPNEAITKNSYDAFNRLTKTVINKDKKTITYNSFHPIKETGPSGETITYEYDGAGRKIATKQEERLTSYDYDAKGRLLHEKNHLSPDTWISKRYKYDDLDRVYLEKTHDSSQRVCTSKIYGYDAENNRTSITQNIDGQLAESTISYKPHSLPQVITDADGYQTNHRYFHFFKNSYGQSVYRHDTIDARGCTDEERYDARHNLDEVLRFDPLGNIIAKKKLFHDASNNLLRIHESVIVNGQEQKQIITLFTYGPYHRLDAITEAAGTPEEKTTRYIYNKHGQKETIIYADGTKLYHTYDTKGRLKRYYSEDGTIDYTYEYDKSDRVTKVTNNLTHKETKRSYNTFGEVLSEELETGLKLFYSYDKAGRLQDLTLPDNSKIGYAYSPTFLESITRIKGEELYRHKITSRDQAGHIQSCLLPKNAGTLTYNYDKLSRRTKTLHDKFQEEAQNFDQVGNLLELQTGNDHRSFRYDFLSQLIEEKGPTAHTYSYDSLYNRLSQDDQKYTVNSLHSVLSDSKHKFTYDARGNRTTKDNISYKYDALDRLIAVGTTTYTYDAFNRRLTKSDGTRYIYALDNEIGAVNSEGKITELRLLGEGLGAEIGSAVAIELEDTLYIPLHDRQGNVTTLLDVQGQVADSYRYDAFGNEITPAHKTKNPWRFSSKRVDEETGLVYFGRRYYDTSLGKWLTHDPLGIKAGPNLYAYVMNSPLTKFDLYGLYAEGGYNPRDWRPYECQHPQVRNAQYRSIESRYRECGYQTQAGPIHKRNERNYKVIPLQDRPTLPGATIVYTPGLNTTFAKSIEDAMYISDQIGGYQVHVNQNFTYSLPCDVARAASEKYVGYEAEAAKNLKDFLEETSNTQGPDHKFFLIGFSEGAIVTSNALNTSSPKVQNATHAVGICPGMLIDKSKAEITKNFVNKHPWRDFVPYLDSLSGLLGAWHRNERNCNVEYFKSHPDAPIFDHDVRSPTYREPFTKQFKDFQNKVEMQ